MSSKKSLLVSLRDVCEDDVPMLCQYWFHSPKGFIESLGVDPAKLPTESQFKEAMINKCQQMAQLPTSKMNALIIEVSGRPVGFHTVNPFVEGDRGIFHAHLWDESLRGQGVGSKSYPIACEVFMERFRFQKIVFKTPVQNAAAIRVKEKLGIRSLGEERIGFGLIKENTLAKVFELTADELADLKTAQ